MVVRLAIFLMLMLCEVLAAGGEASKTTYSLGFFEGGESLYHTKLRREFMAQLNTIVPDTVEILPDPYSYANAQWKRDSSKFYAQRLATTARVDLMITMGPWVVEDLLEAGYSGPILSMHRVNPYIEGLVDGNGRPVASNLTVHYKRNKIENDLAALISLVRVRNLAVLYFPNGDETAGFMDYLNRLVEPLGINLHIGEGSDNYGTYAFFKAYQNLKDRYDAIYLFPFWGMSPGKTTDFLAGVNRDRLPTMAWEGKVLVDRGCALGNSGSSMAAEARFNARKAWAILKGATPAELLVDFEVPVGLSINQGTIQEVGLKLPPDLLNEAVLMNPFTPTPSGFLTLRDAIRRTVESHPDYLAQLEAIEASRLSTKRAWTNYLPQVGLDYRLSHHDDNSLNNNEDRLDKTGQALTLTLDQTLLNLQVRDSARVATGHHQVSEAGALAIRRDLELAAVAAYFEYLQAQEILAAVQDIRLETVRHLEAAEAVFQLDSVQATVWFRWLAERDRVVNDVSRARRNVRLATISLNTLLNLPTDVHQELDSAGYGEAALALSLQRLEGVWRSQVRRGILRKRLLGTALENHPHLVQARSRTDLAASMLGSNRTRWYPTIGFQARLALVDQLKDRPPTFEEKSPTLSLGGHLKWSLFEGGDRSVQHGQLQANLSHYEYLRDAASLGVMQHVLASLAEVYSQSELAFRTIRQRNVLREGYRWTQDEELRKSEEFDTDDVLDLLRQRQQAETGAIAERYAYYMKAARVVYACGWSLHERREGLAATLVALMLQ